MKSRRSFIKTSGYAAAGSLLLPLGCAPKNTNEEVAVIDNTPEVPLAKKSMGVQVYSVRDALKEDFKGSIGKIADIGYEYIEAYGLGVDGTMYGMSAQEYRDIVEDTGMTIMSSHCTYFKAEESEALINAALTAGLTYVIVPYLGEEQRGDYYAIAENLNKAGAMFKEAGLQLGYHNHDFEFEKQGDEVALEILLKETDPELVTFQADLYWVVKAGSNPIELIQKYPGRFTTFHVKDAQTDLEQTTVGSGIVEFEKIFNIKDTAGMKHYFVEDERTDDPFKNLQDAYTYLNQASFT
jgi:sugar phosphate isomerase/epimerase